MRLAIDVGNSSVKWAMGTADAFVGTGSVDLKSPNLAQRLKFSLMERRWNFENEAFGVCVAPSVRKEINEAIPNIVWLESYEAQTIKIRYENREKLGADRVANAFAMYHLGVFPAICVDLGTATNIDILDLSGSYIGGAIMPGPQTAVHSLLQDAEMLQDFDFSIPPKAIGSSTEDCLRVGCVRGYKFGLEALINAMAFELGQSPRVYITGGLSRSPVAPARADVIDQMFTLKGVLAWAERYV